MPKPLGQHIMERMLKLIFYKLIVVVQVGYIEIKP